MHDNAIAASDVGGDVKQRVTVVGAATTLLLGAAKVVFGVTAQSQALIVDGVHSLSDLVSDALVLAGTSIGGKAPDHNHPFGHERFETLATAAIGLVLLATAGSFAFNAVRGLAAAGNSPAVSDGLALPVALASLAAKEGLYRYTRRMGRRAASRLIEANAWHHRSDALSSAAGTCRLASALPARSERAGRADGIDSAGDAAGHVCSIWGPSRSSRSASPAIARTMSPARRTP